MLRSDTTYVTGMADLGAPELVLYCIILESLETLQYHGVAEHIFKYLTEVFMISVRVVYSYLHSTYGYQNLVRFFVEDQELAHNFLRSLREYRPKHILSYQNAAMTIAHDHPRYTAWNNDVVSTIHIVLKKNDWMDENPVKVFGALFGMLLHEIDELGVQWYSAKSQESLPALCLSTICFGGDLLFHESGTLVLREPTGNESDPSMDSLEQIANTSLSSPWLDLVSFAFTDFCHQTSYNMTKYSVRINEHALKVI